MNLPEDIPQQAIEVLKTADRAHTEELLNVAIQVAALCQQKLRLDGMFFTVEANDDVIVSIVRDLGKGSAPYARVHHISRKIEIVAPLPEPKSRLIPKGTTPKIKRDQWLRKGASTRNRVAS